MIEVYKKEGTFEIINSRLKKIVKLFKRKKEIAYFLVNNSTLKKHFDIKYF